MVWYSFGDRAITIFGRKEIEIRHDTPIVLAHITNKMHFLSHHEMEFVHSTLRRTWLDAHCKITSLLGQIGTSARAPNFSTGRTGELPKG